MDREIDKKRKQLEKERADAGIISDLVSPKVLPTYTHGNKEFEKSPFPGASK